MDQLYDCCAGLDVHKETVVATVRRRKENGKLWEQTRRYGTMTEQLLELADRLEAEGVTHVAMESTGVYWKPIWNLMEDRFKILLVNAQTCHLTCQSLTGLRCRRGASWCPFWLCLSLPFFAFSMVSHRSESQRSATRTIAFQGLRF